MILNLGSSEVEQKIENLLVRSSILLLDIFKKNYEFFCNRVDKRY